MFEIGKLVRLDLGYQGENKARVIAIDMTAWLEEFPGATVGMMLRRPDEDVFYPAALEMEDGIIEFEVTRADVAIAGEGEAQIILTNEDDVELRSRVVKTKINASMSGTEVEAPPPETTFVTQVINAAAQAEAAVEKMPSIGENGNWYAWDAETGTYVDTGKPSRGEQGIQGATGPAGPQGEKGDTGAQGPKGDTGPQGEKGDTGPKGPKGDTGPQGAIGPAGPQGETGPAGADGKDGKDGTGVTILGNYDSESALKEAHPTGNPGDAYMVDGYLYVWSASGSAWQNVGKIQGPQGEKGEKGDTGATGATGPQGEKGDTGPQGPQGETGSAGAAGADGADGVGIKSVTQTTTSSADGGSNVITVTKTDGTTSTFTVKNGSKGSTGADGADGKDGKDAVTSAIALTILSTAWTGDAAPYTATVACSGVTESNHIIVGAGGALTAEQQAAMAAAMIVCTGQGAESITLTAFGEVPTIDLPVNVMIVG